MIIKCPHFTPTSHTKIEITFEKGVSRERAETLMELRLRRMENYPPRCYSCGELMTIIWEEDDVKK